MRQILVAVDESEASARVSDFVNRFFEGLDVSVIAVNVGRVPIPVAVPTGAYAAPGATFTWPYGPAAPPAGEPAAETAAAETTREKGEQAIASSGIQVDEQIVELAGDVADALRRLAAERDVDLIVVGSNHKGFLERLLSPSVSAELTDAAPRPTLVVH